MSAPLVLAWDPSLRCTGFALVRGTELLDAGMITPSPSEGHPFERLLDLQAEAQAVIDGMHKVGEVVDGMHRTGPIRGPEDLTCAVVEWPRWNEARTQGQRQGGSIATYGMAVWAVTNLRYPAGVPILTPSVTDWSRKYAGTAKDKYKERRQRQAEGLYVLPRRALGPVTTAGNVADAALLAHWVVQRLRHVSLEELVAVTRKMPVRRKRGQASKAWEAGLGAGA